MTEVPKVGELDAELRQHQNRMARNIDTEAIERAMREPPTKPIEVALYVNGRLVTIKTDSETVFRVLGILTGLDR